MIIIRWVRRSMLLLFVSAHIMDALSSQPLRMAPLPDVKCPSVEYLLEPFPGPVGTTDAIFLGTGGSSGTPHLHCLLATRDTRVGDRNVPCETCRMALEGDPRDNKNFRGNPSLLIRHRTPDNGIENILIDAGKVRVHSTFPTHQRSCTRIET